MDYVIPCLLAYCALREVFFMRTVDRLTSKIMSRNYYDLQVSDAHAKAVQEPKPQELKDYGPPEDLGSLQGIHPGF